MIKQFISVVIPAFNAERTIAQCLDSIEQSIYPRDCFEIIVVDNNSTDRTAELIKESAAKYVFEPRQGRSIARNTGIDHSAGEYIAFLDADTFIHSQWLDEMATALNRQDIGGVQGQIIPAQEDGRTALNNYRYRSTDESTEGSFIILDIVCHESPMINSAACMYKKEALKIVKGFDPELERHEDIDLSKRILYSGFNLKAVPSALAYVHFHGEGWKDYFLRAYRHGLTKCDYWRKWQLLRKDIASPSEQNQLSPKRLKKQAIYTFQFPKNRGKILVTQAIKDFTYYAAKAIFEADRYYLIKIAEQLAISAGRICGQFRNQHGNLDYNFLLEGIAHQANLNGITLSLRHDSRLIFSTQATYILNTRDDLIHKFPNLLSIFIGQMFGEKSLSYEQHFIQALQEIKIIDVPQYSNDSTDHLVV